MFSLNTHILPLLHQCPTLSHLKELQALILTFGHGQTPFFAFKLLRSAAPHSLSYARRIFDNLAAPNLHLYAALISSYSSLPLPIPLPALRLFLRLLRSPLRPNHFIYPHALKSSPTVPLAKSIHTHILKSGYSSNPVVQTSLIDTYSRFSETTSARQLFDTMLHKNLISWTAMVSGYCRSGRVGNALLLFEEMPERDVPAWNAAISGCAQNGLFTDAVAIFHRMVLSGALPNRTTVVCVLSACGNHGILRLGKWLHGYVLKSRIADSLFVSNALIDMYGKCGSLKEARWIFSELTHKSLTSWNSMINCLALHGRSEHAITIFGEMLIEQAQPDEITFVGLLNACVHAGLVDKGLGYFESMRREYGIEPKIEHYGCVIDLLGRAGRFDEAIGIVGDMGVEPDEVVWGSLLNSCRIHKQTGLAELAVQKLLEIDPDNANYGVVLANLYSECGNWEEAREVRKMLKGGGGKKLPGCSWIEVDSEVHKFYSGDKLHHGIEAICEVLGDLVGLVEA